MFERTHIMSLSFYNNPDLADGFGATAGRSRPHRGLDFPHRTGVGIPSVAAGVVVISEWSGALGNIIEVRHDDGRFFGYCHMNARGLTVGTRVSQGTILGAVGNTGSESFGSHVHVTNGNRQGAVYGASMNYLADPWPYIQAAMNGGGGEAGFERAPGGEPGAPMWPVGALMARIQRGLSLKKRYNYADGSPRPADGIGGEHTAKGIQRTLNHSRKNGKVPYVPTTEDGKLGPNNGWGVQHYGKAYGDYDGRMDGDPRVLSWTAFALGLERP